MERALKFLEEKDAPKDKPARKAPSLRELQQYYSASPDDLPEDIRPLVTEDARRLFAYWLGVQYESRQKEQVV